MLSTTFKRVIHKFKKAYCTAHVPVLTNEVLGALSQTVSQSSNPILVDCTFGGGGHSRAILDHFENVKLFSFDRDKNAVDISGFQHERITLAHAKSSDILNKLKEFGLSPRPDGSWVDAILMDLGLSSIQIDSPRRGFSWKVSAPLDMRMDTTEDIHTALHYLNTLSTNEIAQILWKYGRDKYSRLIAKEIKAQLQTKKKLKTTDDLAKLIEECRPADREGPGSRQHASRRTFQALRMHVNSELEILWKTLTSAEAMLTPNIGIYFLDTLP
eukprot:TRINITY_DN2248_c0_g1_i4.p1 TRINITY_DN2248_c0_g1~~TRINITY_DN2248_c0_g1_i4.p1  ORF type:complete len:271 (+),score=36.56 TRINITY_DN2248_c0_g1_i4:46-858(+)